MSTPSLRDVRYPEYQFPATRFVDENTEEQQFWHILSEAEEMERAEEMDVDLEMVDLLHSIETRLRQLARDKGEEYVARLFDQVEEKNERRGYYCR